MKNMTIEEKIFQKKRFDPARMERFGFVTEDGIRTIRMPFLNGDFAAALRVSGDGHISGTVVDMMNGEEYAPLRNERFNGAYVNSVRSAYEELLQTIAQACCTDVLFASDQANRIAARIANRFGAEPDFPWSKDPYDSAGVFRHADTEKWFALVMNITVHALKKNGDRTPIDAINLKIDPPDGPKLTETDGIFPAYHMNHKSWITVTLDDRLSDDAVMALIENSYRLTNRGTAAKR